MLTDMDAQGGETCIKNPVDPPDGPTGKRSPPAEATGTPTSRDRENAGSFKRQRKTESSKRSSKKRRKEEKVTQLPLKQACKLFERTADMRAAIDNINVQFDEMPYAVLRDALEAIGMDMGLNAKLYLEVLGRDDNAKLIQYIGRPDTAIYMHSVDARPGIICDLQRGMAG